MSPAPCTWGMRFEHTIMDALIRYHRMRGFDTLWQPGTDHAGIATQMVVERQLNAEGKKPRRSWARGVRRARLAMEGNLRRHHRESNAPPGRTRSIGSAIVSPWTPALSQTVTEVFVRLYEEGLIYRGKRLVNWDPVLKTAVSDLEVVAEEESGSLWHLRYPLSDGDGLPGGGDHAAGNHAGRCRGRRASRRCALPAFDRPQGAAAARRSRNCPSSPMRTSIRPSAAVA